MPPLHHRLRCAIDVSLDVFPGMMVYPGECEVERHFHLDPHDSPEPVTCTHWSMTAHAGTHLDAPRHFVPEGQSITDFTPDFFEFHAVVVDATHLRSRGAHVGPELVRQVLRPGVDAVLFKTHGGELWRASAFDPQHTAVAPEAAGFLAAVPGMRLVGIDYFSVEPFGSNPARTHLALLGAGLFILEGLDLAHVQPGFYDLMCVPARWRDSEAAPCRAILFPPPPP